MNPAPGVNLDRKFNPDKGLAVTNGNIGSPRLSDLTFQI